MLSNIYERSLQCRCSVTDNFSDYFHHDTSKGVLALSWYPPLMKDDNGEPTDDIVPLILEAAAKYKIKVGVFLR